MPETPELEGFDEIEVVGRGGFGVVYKARQIDFDRLVAIKVLSDVFDDQTRSRFDRERRALGALSSHPNIVQVHASGLTEDGRPYLVMELAPGGSLADRVAREGPLPWHEAAAVGAKLADALDVAHTKGVLHRDIKPENVLFSSFGEPMLADFGIAQMVGQTATRTGIVTASVEHAAPEVLDGKRATQASDQYALASTIFSALTGEAPFVHDGDESMIPMIARMATEPPPDLRPRGIPDTLCTPLERGLAKDDHQRYPTAREFAQALRGAAGEPPRPPPQPAAAAGGGGSSASSTRRVDGPTPSEPEGPGRRRISRWVLIGSLGVLVVLGGVAAIVIGSSGGSGSKAASHSSGSGSGSSVVLYNDSLAAASTALQPSSDSSSSSSFTNGGLQITNKNAGGSVNITPTFAATGAQLASVTAQADVALADPQQGAGLACRVQGGGDRYAFLITRSGAYGIFKNSGNNSTELQSGSTTASDNYHLQIACSGPANPRVTDTVNLRFQVGTNSVTTADSNSALSTGKVGMEVDGASTALFGNLAVSSP
jgi:serine/threonine protein kinase